LTAKAAGETEVEDEVSGKMLKMTITEPDLMSKISIRVFGTHKARTKSVTNVVLNASILAGVAVTSAKLA
jgi:hypothetical protein